jgi:hypothetical protein
MEKLKSDGRSEEGANKVPCRENPFLIFEQKPFETPPENVKSIPGTR